MSEKDCSVVRINAFLFQLSQGSLVGVLVVMSNPRFIQIGGVHNSFGFFRLLPLL